MLLTHFFQDLLCLALIYKVTSAFNITDPDVSGVHYGNLEDKNQYIDVDELNPVSGTERITVALITDITEELSIQQSGVPCDAKIEDGNSTDLKIVTMNAFDYEVLRLFGVFTIGLDIIPDDNLANQFSLTINIQNIDDEPPSLIVLPMCEMEENNSTAVCRFVVRDQDGFLQQIDFSDIDSEVADIFEFKYDTIPDDSWQGSDVFLVLKKTLDYETIQSYEFQARIKDGAGHNANPPASTIVVNVIDQPDDSIVH